MTWATELSDSILKPVELRIGKLYEHPQDGPIIIQSGCYRDPIYDRVSNFWYWKVISTGEIHNGYGGNWPEITRRVSYHGRQRSKLGRSGDAVFAAIPHHISHHLVFILDDDYEKYGICRLVGTAFIGEPDSDSDIRWME